MNFINLFLIKKFMMKKEFDLIALSIWWSGFIPDKNKIKQKAKEEMRKLIASDIIGTFRKYKNFNEQDFIKQCNVNL